jgi:hypothetical protein
MRNSKFLTGAIAGVSMLAFGSLAPIAYAQVGAPAAGRNGSVNNEAGLNPKMKGETKPGANDWPQASATPGPIQRFANPPLRQRPPGAGVNQGVGESGSTSGEVPGNNSAPANPDYPNSGTR